MRGLCFQQTLSLGSRQTADLCCRLWRKSALIALAASEAFGASRCQVPAERCYWHEPTHKWTCARPGTLEGGIGEGMACDDASDCQAGMACCSLLMVRVESACVPRNRLHQQCRAELCVQGSPPCPVGRTCTASS